MRGEGWLDWHILSAIFAVTINYRVRQDPTALANKDIYATLFNKMMDTPESEDASPIPFEEFTIDKLKKLHDGNMIATLKVLGLECHQLTPDFKAISHFLRHRYNYWSDDIQHDDLLSG